MEYTYDWICKVSSRNIIPQVLRFGGLSLEDSGCKVTIHLMEVFMLPVRSLQFVEMYEEKEGDSIQCGQCDTFESPYWSIIIRYSEIPKQPRILETTSPKSSSPSKSMTLIKCGLLQSEVKDHAFLLKAYCWWFRNPQQPPRMYKTW